jgi:Fic family protein
LFHNIYDLPVQRWDEQTNIAVIEESRHSFPSLLYEQKPLLYLSYFFKVNRTEYYAKLTNIRTRGEWENWIRFFLTGVIETSEIACALSIEVHELHKKDLSKIETELSASAKPVFDLFCRHPIMDMAQLKKFMPGKPIPTLQRALNNLLKIGVLKETSGLKRNRRYVYKAYLALLTRDTTTRIG